MRRLIITFPLDSQLDMPEIIEIQKVCDERFAAGLPIYLPEGWKYEVVDVRKVDVENA